MAKDGEPGVHAEVASQVMDLSLAAILADQDFRVRLAAVERIEESALAPFLDDPEDIIRELAYSRLITSSKQYVSHLMDDRSRITARDPYGPKEMTL